MLMFPEKLRRISLKQSRVEDQSGVWCIAGLSEVQNTMNKCSYPSNLIHYVEGDVLDTLPGKAPDRIAMLRLDTDWYESTKHELEVLFPPIVSRWSSDH